MRAGRLLEGADRDPDEPVVREIEVVIIDHPPEQVFGSDPVPGHAPRLPRAVPRIDGRPGSSQGFPQVLADALSGLPRDLHVVPVAVSVFLVQGEHRGGDGGEPLPVNGLAVLVKTNGPDPECLSHPMRYIEQSAEHDWALRRARASVLQQQGI